MQIYKYTYTLYYIIHIRLLTTKNKVPRPPAISSYFVYLAVHTYCLLNRSIIKEVHFSYVHIEVLCSLFCYYFST